MALRIIWTPQADKGLQLVIEYLEEQWTEVEILNLEQELKDFLERISKYPKIYPSTGKYKNVRKGLINENNYIVYRIKPRKGIIELINFRATKQKPL